MSFIGKLGTLYLPVVQWPDLIEICILIFLIYRLIVGLKNTRAMVLLKGILVLFIFYNIAYICSFQAILVIFKSSITICIFAILLMFQPEMRKFLEQIGTKNIADKLNIKSIFMKQKKIQKYYSDKTISELVKACYSMGEVKTGALIVIEREIPLTEYIETGIGLHADLTSQLLINTFEKNTPLHDGAIIQIGDKIISATCYLPLSSNTKISKHMGTRHRAAIGVSEVTDCLVIVVSEETGKISLVVNGEIKSSLTKEMLNDLLFKYQVKTHIDTVDVSKHNVKKAVKSVFSSNELTTKVVAILVGLFGWVLLMNVADPLTTRVIENIPIEMINTSVIESTGKTFELLSDSSVDVKVTDRRSVVDTLKKENISVIADLSKLSYVNAVPLQGFIEEYPSVIVSFVEDNTITLSLDSVISKEFEVQIKNISESNGFTYVPILSSDVSNIVITGGKTKIDTIDKIVFECDSSNATEEYREQVKPIVYDKNGAILKNDLFTFSIDSIEIYGTVYNIKEIPLNLQVNDNITNGYKIAKISYVPDKISITGSDDILSKIDSLDIFLDATFDINATSNNQFIKTVSITKNLPENIYLAGTDDILTVTIDFEALKTKTVSFSNDDISFIGLTDDLIAGITDTEFSVIISGEDEELSKITKETLLPFIDLMGLSEGSYNLILQFKGLDNATLVSNISVNLVVTKK